MKNITVVAAIIFNDNRILCVQRNINQYTYISKKYEFPGGKIEKGESNEAALKREITEELNIIINVKNKFMVVNHSYPDFKLTMHAYICESHSNDITLMEHINYKWLNRHELDSLDWAEADIPIVNKLMMQ